MKILLACSVLVGLSLTAFAADTAPAKDANAKPAASAQASNKPADSTKPAPPPAPPAAAAPVSTSPSTPTSTLTLDAYIADLASNLPLSKTEQTDVTTYYLNDGKKLQGILSDPSLSPLTQAQLADDLRDARNAKVEALLADVGRQSEFLKIEANYRVALVELAAQGGLVPTAPTPNVPEPTATPANQADKTAPGM